MSLAVVMGIRGKYGVEGSYPNYVAFMGLDGQKSYRGQRCEVWFWRKRMACTGDYTNMCLDESTCAAIVVIGYGIQWMVLRPTGELHTFAREWSSYEKKKKT